MASRTSVTVSFLWLTARRYIAYEIYWKKFYARTKEDRTNFYAVLNKRASAAVFFYAKPFAVGGCRLSKLQPRKISFHSVCVCVCVCVPFRISFFLSRLYTRSRSPSFARLAFAKYAGYKDRDGFYRSRIRRCRGFAFSALAFSFLLGCSVLWLLSCNRIVITFITFYRSAILYDFVWWIFINNSK